MLAKPVGIHTVLGDHLELIGLKGTSQDGNHGQRPFETDVKRVCES